MPGGTEGKDGASDFVIVGDVFLRVLKNSTGNRSLSFKYYPGHELGEECEELSGSSSSSWFHALRDSVQAALSDTPGASPVLSSDSEDLVAE